MQNESTSESVSEPESRFRSVLILILATLILAATTFGHYRIGPDISFGIFYLIPIWLVAWNLNRGVAIFAAFVCAAAGFGVDNLIGKAGADSWIGFWNAAVRLSYFLTFTLLISAHKGKLHETTKEVQRLKGLLPICAACKKIRDDEGDWHNIEEYITAHSEAGFTHGMCPDCVRQYYPEISEKVLGASPKRDDGAA